MDYFPLFIGLLPSFAWLVFYLEEDPHPEPKKLIFETFLAGAVATFIVFSVQMSLNNLAISNGIAQYTILSFFILSFVEEIFKFGAARLVIGEHRKDFDEPVDAMVYPIIAALGFAAVENVAAAFSTHGDLAFETITLRFIGATLLHTISSGLLGYYWAISLIKGKKWILANGMLLATALHVAFNYLILRYEPVVVPTTLLIVAALFLMIDFEKLKKI